MKIIIHIDCPDEWNISNDWDSHKPALWLALINTQLDNQPVCEFGCGEGSTPLVRKYCGSKRYFFSYETNEEYAKKYDSTKMNDYDEIHLSEEPFRQGVLFIDLAPASQRKEMIAKHATHADVIVVHDSEETSEFCYGMKDILSTFKYRLDFRPEGYPATTIVSNFINVEDWI